MRMILAGLLLLSAIPAAQAASFDCAKASTPVEKAICTNPELGRRDEVLAKAYATALGGLGDEAKAAIQSGQRNWLDFAALACTTDAKPFKAALIDDQQSCLVSVYNSRIHTLGDSRMQGDWRFYPISSFAVVDDPDPDSFQGVAAKGVTSPRIDDPSETAQTFNKLMDEADQEVKFDPDEEGYTTSDTTQSTGIESVTPHRISLVTDSYWMGHGAAHGNYATTYAHYLVDKNRMIEASDLFTHDGWEDALGKLALDELDRTVEGGIWEESRADVPKTAADPTRWKFTDRGLDIIFEPYEVTAYAAGTPTITIPWDKLTDYLSENYYELLY